MTTKSVQEAYLETRPTFYDMSFFILPPNDLSLQHLAPQHVLTMKST